MSHTRGQDSSPNTGAPGFNQIGSCRASSQPNNCLLQPIQAIHIELNAFNVGNDTDDHGLDRRPDPLPRGWISVGGYKNSYWPYDPMDPDGKGQLKAGDYVIFRGTLWEDVTHVQGPCLTLGGLTCSGTGENPDKWQQAAWVFATNRQHGGWLEIHPPDSIYRPSIPPKRTREVYALSAAAMGSFISPDRQMAEALIKPRYRPAPNYHGILEQLVDGRFTDLRTVRENLIVPLPDGSYYLRARVQTMPSNPFGTFKASYVLSYKAGPALPTAPPTALAGEWYRIVAKHSGQILDVTGTSCADRTQVIQWPRKAGEATSQFWAFIPAGDGSWYVVNSRSGEVLDVEQGSQSPGAHVIQYPLNYERNQRFLIDSVGDGSVRITSVHSGLSLDIEGASRNSGARLIQWVANGDANQRYQLQPVGARINWRTAGASCF